MPATKRVSSNRWKDVPHSLKPLAQSVIEARLPNGLTVRLLPNDAVPTISFYTFFKVGSRNERPGITGISHLFEHMMFNGAKKYGPGQFDRVLESNGGSSNAYTSTDLTVYYEDCMAEALELVIDLEADRMRSLQVTPKMLESERQVVIEERRLRVDNDTMGLMDEELGSTMWKAHPYRWPVIGWMSDIEAITRDDCLDYFRTYYAPNNATVYVSGDFDPEKCLKLLTRFYSGIKAGPAVPKVANAEPQQRGVRRAEVEYPSQAPSLMIGYRGPPASHADTLALDVLQYALAVGQGSRLTKALVFEQEAAVSVSIDWSWRLDPGAFTVHLELKPGADPAKSEAALYRELDRVIKDGFETREVEKACNNLQAQLLRELATNNGRAHALGHYEMMLGSWQAGLALASRYPTIRKESLQKAAATYLAPNQRSVVTLVPSEEAS